LPTGALCGLTVFLIIFPSGQGLANMGERGEQGLIQELVAQTAVEAFYEGVLGLARPGASWDHRSIAMLVSSVPLSDTHVAGGPRLVMIVSSSRPTRSPDSDVSASRQRHSRVKSTTTARILKPPSIGQRVAYEVQ
jgi:hypothetical protein